MVTKLYKIEAKRFMMARDGFVVTDVVDDGLSGTCRHQRRLTAVLESDKIPSPRLIYAPLLMAPHSTVENLLTPFP